MLFTAGGFVSADVKSPQSSSAPPIEIKSITGAGSETGGADVGTLEAVALLG